MSTWYLNYMCSLGWNFDLSFGFEKSIIIASSCDSLFAIVFSAEFLLLVDIHLLFSFNVVIMSLI